ncbi:MAG TPA: NAD(P)H-dependent oxidoreductase [Gemmatimonadales bacterium]|nr:NAD(P)H-dependent oxidoreductase [Gemmatimonadales bacterium]
MVDSMPALGVSGSPAAASRSRTLLERALIALERHGAGVQRVHLADLPADALLGRREDPAVQRALAAVQETRILVVSTPIYRATYSGLLKVFFDLLPQDALAGKVAVAIATGASPAHCLALDHGLHPLFASVGAVVVPTSVYGIDAQFRDGVPDGVLLERVERAVAEALVLAGALKPVEA